MFHQKKNKPKKQKKQDKATNLTTFTYLKGITEIQKD